MWNTCPIRESVMGADSYGAADQAEGVESANIFVGIGWFDVEIDIGVFIDTTDGVDPGVDFALYVDGSRKHDLPSLNTKIRLIVMANKDMKVVQVRDNPNIVQASFGIAATAIKKLCCEEG